MRRCNEWEVCDREWLDWFRCRSAPHTKGVKLSRVTHLSHVTRVTLAHAYKMKRVSHVRHVSQWSQMSRMWHMCHVGIVIISSMLLSHIMSHNCTCHMCRCVYIGVTNYANNSCVKSCVPDESYLSRGPLRVARVAHKADCTGMPHMQPRTNTRANETDWSVSQTSVARSSYTEGRIEGRPVYVNSIARQH